MKKYQCPNCGNETISFWMKMKMANGMGPNYPRCDFCGKKYGYTKSLHGIIAVYLLITVAWIIGGYSRFPLWVLILGCLLLIALERVFSALFIPVENKEGKFSHKRRLRCPNCGEMSIPFMIKINMSLHTTIVYPKCELCDKKYGYPDQIYLAVVALYLTEGFWIYASVSRFPVWLIIIVVLLILVLEVTICYFFLPFESKEDS